MTYFGEIAKYIDDEVLRHEVENGEAGKRLYPGFRGPQHQSIAGRLIRYRNEHLEKLDADDHPEVEFSRREMQTIGIDYQVVFPTALLALGMHPDPVIETEMRWAYTRWLTEEILPHAPHVKTMVYLPMNEPEACCGSSSSSADGPGVVGFMVTSARYRPVHANEYMRALPGDRGAGDAALLPRELSPAGAHVRGDEQVPVGPRARVHLLQPGPHHEHGHQRDTGAVPEPEAARGSRAASRGCRS